MVRKALMPRNFWLISSASSRARPPWTGATTMTKANVLTMARAKTNHRFLGFLHNLKQSGCHVALLHRLKDVYEERTVRTRQGKTTERVKVDGVYERDGNSKTDFACNTEVFLFHDPEKSDVLEEQYGMRITRCTSRPSLIGKEKWGVKPNGERRVSFRALAKLVFPQQEW